VTTDQYLSEMEEALEFPKGTLEPDVDLVTLPLWDSMQRLVFIAKTEEKTGVVLEGTDVENAKTVGDLLELLNGALE
jgi:acyl carrier protein